MNRNGFFCSKSVQGDHSHMVQAGISTLVLILLKAFFAEKTLSELRLYARVMLFKALILSLTTGNRDCQDCGVVLYLACLTIVSMLPNTIVFYSFYQMKHRGPATVVLGEECGEFLIFLGA